MRHRNRMTRNQGTRMVKMASRGQRELKRGNLGPEGLSCPVCSPKPWAAANRRQRQEAAAIEQIEEH